MKVIFVVACLMTGLALAIAAAPIPMFAACMLVASVDNQI